MELDELDKRLAKWRWPGKNVKVAHGWIKVYEHGSIYPVTYQLFTLSVENCFDLLAPKLAEKGIVVMVGSFEHSGYYACVHHFLDQEPEVVRAERPALALSEAIGRFLDSEKRDRCSVCGDTLDIQGQHGPGGEIEPDIHCPTCLRDQAEAHR